MTEQLIWSGIPLQCLSKDRVSDKVSVCFLTLQLSAARYSLVEGSTGASWVDEKRAILNNDYMYTYIQSKM